MTPKTDNARRVLRLKNAALYLSVSTRCIRGLIQSGALPLVKLSENGNSRGSAWLVDVHDLDQLVERSKVNLQ
jgi:hypothetical protein